MALKIRLRRQGRTNRPFYRLVVIEGTKRREGRYVEMVGWYNPLEEQAEKQFSFDGQRITYWLDQGATLSEGAEALVARGAPEVANHLREKRAAAKKK